MPWRHFANFGGGGGLQGPTPGAYACHNQSQPLSTHAGYYVIIWSKSIKAFKSYCPETTFWGGGGGGPRAPPLGYMGVTSNPNRCLPMPDIQWQFEANPSGHSKVIVQKPNFGEGGGGGPRTPPVGRMGVTSNPNPCLPMTDILWKFEANPSRHSKVIVRKPNCRVGGGGGVAPGPDPWGVWASQAIPGAYACHNKSQPLTPPLGRMGVTSNPNPCLPMPDILWKFEAKPSRHSKVIIRKPKRWKKKTKKNWRNHKGISAKCLNDIDTGVLYCVNVYLNVCNVRAWMHWSVSLWMCVIVISILHVYCRCMFYWRSIRSVWRT